MVDRLLPFEILHRFFVFLGGGFGFERAEVSMFAGLGIFLPRIEAIAALNFSNHGFFVMSTEVETSLNISGSRNSYRFLDFARNDNGLIMAMRSQLALVRGFGPWT